MEKQIFITMDGGLIQDIDVSADLEDIKITIVDFDIEGTRMEISKTPHGEDALIFDYEHAVVGDGDLEFWKEILRAKK